MVSRVPRTGRPYGCPAKTIPYSCRTIAERGLSCSMRASSKITSRSRAISSGANVERNAMSESSWMPVAVASVGRTK